jgi:hypothetical protein
MMFGIGILEILIFAILFLVLAAAGWASALFIIRTLQQR